MCQFINPAKCENGKITKNIIEKITSLLLDKIEVSKCKNTNAVIKWFKDISNIDKYKFIQMGTKYVCPSITEESIAFLQVNNNISNDDIRIIKNSRKSLLFHSIVARKKKSDS